MDGFLVGPDCVFVELWSVQCGHKYFSSLRAGESVEAVVRATNVS